MFFILSKILNFLCQPLTWIIILILLSFWWRGGRFFRRGIVGAFLMLLFFTNDFIVDEVMRWWEVPTIEDKDLKHYDTAIVLGGMSGWDGKIKRIQFFQGSDRLLQTLRLQKMGKVKNIIITSGSAKILHPEEKEANYLQQYLKEIGYDLSHVYFENEAKNTHENAEFSKPILAKLQTQTDTVLLVTSGFHMRRSSLVFDKSGIPHQCFSTDRMAGERKFEFDHLVVPDAVALLRWNFLIKEWVGIAMYKVQGYI